MAWSDAARAAAAEARRRKATQEGRMENLFNRHAKSIANQRRKLRGVLRYGGTPKQMERAVRYAKKMPSLATRRAMGQAKWNAANLAGHTPLEQAARRRVAGGYRETSVFMRDGSLRRASRK